MSEDVISRLSVKLGLSREGVLDLLELKAVSPLRYSEKVARLLGKIHWKQNEVRVDTKPIRLILGGNRSGKTQGAMEIAAMYLLNDYHYIGRDGSIVDRDLGRSGDVWIFSESFELQEATTQPKLLSYIAEDDIGQVSYRRTGIIKSFVVKSTGNKVTFKSYEQGRAKVQGAGLRAVFMDEEPPKDIFQELFTRREAGVDLDMFISMTPVEGMTWVYRDLYQAKDKSDIGVHVMGWNDNPWLTEKQKDSLLSGYKAMGLSMDEIEMRRSGKFISLTGLVCDWFNPNVHRISVDDMPLRKCSHYRVFDFGHSDYAVALFAGFDGDGNCYIYDGINERGLTPESFAYMVKAHSMDYHYVRSWGDGANPEWIQTLNDKGIRTVAVKKMRRREKKKRGFVEAVTNSKKNAWQKALTDVMRKYGKINERTGEPKLYIANHLIQYDDKAGVDKFWLEEQFMQLRWGMKRGQGGSLERTNKWEDTRRYGHHFDGIMALAYLLYMYEYTQSSKEEKKRRKLPKWGNYRLYNDNII